jgi:hypothetical protein
MDGIFENFDESKGSEKGHALMAWPLSMFAD